MMQVLSDKTIMEVFIMNLNLGNVIKKLRIAQSVTQEELAEYLGISFQAVSKWETGTTMPDITLLPKIAIFFGVKIDELFSINHEDELERIDYMLWHDQLTEQNYTYAIRTLDAILRENSNNVDVLKRYADLYLKKTNQDLLRAGQMLEKAMELNPLDTEIYLLYRAVRGGSQYKQHSDNDWFIRVCEPYAKKYPQNYKLYEVLIEAMISMRYFDKAQAYIDIMQCDDKEKYIKEIFLGDIEAAKGNIEAAKRIWNAIPKDNYLGQYEVGERFNRLNEYENAIEYFNNAYEAQTSPRKLDMVFSLAFLYKKLGRYIEAIKAWECIISVLASDYSETDGTTVDWAKQEIEKLNKCIENNCKSLEN